MYYFNTHTGLSSWERPAHSPDDELQHQQQLQQQQQQASMTKSVRCSHILVKHSGSRNPKSWRCPVVTMSKAEAIAKLTAIRAAIVSGETTFVAVAMTDSDCSSAARGGDLGDFGRGQMQKPFEEASFALDVGQMSQIVDTDSGVHIILRAA